MSLVLTILGCSSALPTSKRFPTAQILNVFEQFYLIDCGEGTQIQIRKFKIRINKINHIFISHVHGDHYFGLFGLISTMNLLDRKCDLHVYAPRELEKILNTLLYSYDKLNFTVVFHSINSAKNEVIFENSKITVETIPLKHRVPTTGFIFREKPKQFNINRDAIEKYNLSIKEIVTAKLGNNIHREDGTEISYIDVVLPPTPPASYAYCSDTLYDELIIPLVKNVDMLYHEATYLHKMKDRAQQTFHTTALQAGMIAQKANVKKLIVGHYSARYKDAEEIANEARSVFPETFAAEDGKIFSSD